MTEYVNHVYNTLIMKRFSKKWLLFGLGVLILISALWRHFSTVNAEKIKNEKTYTVLRKTIKKTLTISGKVDAEEKAALRFLTSGRLVWVGVKEGDTVKGVIVENTSGRMAIMGKVIIECTGEGDIAARAGVPFTKINREDREIDPPSITFHMDGVDWDKVTAYMRTSPEDLTRSKIGGRTPTPEQEERNKKIREQLKNSKSILDLVRSGTIGAIDFNQLTREAMDNGDYHGFGDLGFFFTPRDGGAIQPVFQHSAHVPDCDHTDVRELTRGEVEARRQAAIALKAIKKYLPGFENAYFTRITSYMRTRDGRYSVGDYRMTMDDVAEARKFEDVIAKSAMMASVDAKHTARRPGASHSIARRSATPKDGGSYDIPYRCLVPKNVEGMLITGKLISTTEDFKRDLLPENMACGQAAGVAAAVCVKKMLTPRQLEKDVKEVQDILVKQGAVLFGTR